MKGREVGLAVAVKPLKGLVGMQLVGVVGVVKGGVELPVVLEQVLMVDMAPEYTLHHFVSVNAAAVHWSHMCAYNLRNTR